MLNQIRQAWQRFKVAIIAAALLVVYFMGKRKGKTDEKIRQNKTVLENVARANRARAGLADSDTVRRLHNKYKRR